jgi:YegS/Rv2252/BmrU family lipid kinase
MDLPVIVNPVSGPDRPVLKQLAQGFAAVGIAWEIHLTQRAGDAERIAAELARADVPLIAVCGGDGTLKEVATALAGRETVLGILPGGTGNALATELGLPLDIPTACAMLAQPQQVRAIDMGRIGQRLFVLRASLGLETQLLQSTDRNLKSALGGLAYPLTALQAINEIPTVTYTVSVDGQTHTASGIQCTIANSAQMGVAGLKLAQHVSVDDGLLDAIILDRVDLGRLAAIATSNLIGEDLDLEIQHWRGRLIEVTADPPQAVSFGADVIATTPVQAEVLAGVLRVLVG